MNGHDIKQYVDVVFSENMREITKLLEKAISHKEVSFKLLTDSKFDLYKNIQVYVNDGLDRPLPEKGTGIQSAIIIALFSQYCNLFHNTSSLLITEEPELFLHPQARRVIFAELNKFLDASPQQKRQLIISTHSPDFLKNIEPENIIRIHREKDSNETLVFQLAPAISALLDDDIKRLIWSQNTEIFFADRVLLVEGGEVFLLPAIFDKLNDEKQSLDYHNISIARVNGKGSFLTHDPGFVNNIRLISFLRLSGRSRDFAKNSPSQMAPEYNVIITQYCTIFHD